MSLLDKASLIQIPSGYGNGKLYSVKPNPTYGSEEVTNGDFATDSDWNKGSGWTISGGKLVGANANTSTYQGVGIQVNKSYKIEFTVVDYVSGSVRPLLNGLTNVDGTNVSANGTYTQYLNSISTSNGNFTIRGVNLVGSIDNVSVKEITNIGDFDFERSSSATRVNSEGLIEVASVLGTTELVTNGDFASSSNWNFVGDGSISNGELILPCCIFNNRVSQSIGMSSSKLYKLEINITQITSGDTIDYLQGGAWHIFGTQLGINTVTISNPTDANLYLRNNNGAATIKIDNVSVKEVIENDVPRLDYSGGASCASLLLESQTQNLVTYSEDFSQWNALTPGDITYVSDLVNPDGSVGGYKISGDGMYKGLSLLTTTQRSIYARSVSGSGDVQLFTHFSNTNNVFTLTEDWQRFDVNSTTSASAVGNYYIDLRGASSTLSELYVWGAQATNDQSYPTSYIPTNGSTVTRTADVCNNAGTSATFNDNEGVLFFEGSTLVESGITRVISLSDGSTSNNIYFNFNQNANSFNCEVLSGGSTQFNAYATITKVNNNKIALKYKANDFALWINGTEVATDTSGSVPSGLDRLNFDFGQGSFDFEGKTKQLMVFNEALSDEELSDLTGQVNDSFVQLANFYNYTIL